ncbi:TetR/AcrR family transcriptional regulator [Eubacterium sp.]|uniref:TetR/AcrR family transcriptional regulator n=1 Tax=Eubacterium sp. TaxID=142586 RepID=UPI00258CA3FB|nr:TetR/AcrR family transcriptional regulator [Eubacterium sp.]MCR5368201.1 TetR/AcrR family transcriptional regulator [Eubacterium sp.]
MDNEKETKKKLLECAMREFSEKGYMKASLRNICKEAGVTTGALYFFFKDKEDLFGNLVSDVLYGLNKTIDNHFSEEMKVAESFESAERSVAELAAEQGFDDDKAVAKEVIHYLFSHKDVVDLLLTKSQGSRYESIRDVMVEKMERHYTSLYVVWKGYKSKKQLTKEDKFIIHWLSHDQVEIVIHIFTHCKNAKEGEKQIDKMMAYLIGGWYGVINY